MIVKQWLAYLLECIKRSFVVIQGGKTHEVVMPILVQNMMQLEVSTILYYPCLKKGTANYPLGEGSKKGRLQRRSGKIIPNKMSLGICAKKLSPLFLFLAHANI